MESEKSHARKTVLVDDRGVRTRLGTTLNRGALVVVWGLLQWPGVRKDR